MHSLYAVADPEDSFNISAGAGIQYEDNLFRLPDSANTRATLGESNRSDKIYTTNIGLKYDKPYSLQRFQLDADVIDNRYDTYDFLDYTAFNYRAAWIWSLTPNITGILLANQQQVLNSFSEFRDVNNNQLRSRSIQTNQARIFTIDGFIGGGWHLLGGLSDIRSRNSETFVAVGDYKQRGAEAGVKYVTRANTSISLVQRASKGKNEGRVIDVSNQIDTGFDEKETEAKLEWPVTGKSRIDARLGYVTRDHDNFSSRDYEGAVGRIAHIWKPTGKLRVNTSLSRNLISFQQLNNSYYVSDTLAISPAWQVTPKTNLKLAYDYSERDYKGAIIPTARDRKDKVHGLMFVAEWEPTRTILISGYLRRQKRDSNFDTAGSPQGDLTFDANSANISAQILF
ncbi:MAG: XrtB/PEP-CTERM-associated polysaccharide biosynthesis outer membrane protein EpsL [Methylophilaceae bacterium]|nr:XrtB/PEP-CTERM-associated polysaccharide biosynthesis outer membrane protein EpsL [Methylophilaceae bacterium]